MTAPVGPYTPVLRSGDWIITSGQVGLDASAEGGPALVPGGMAAELRQALSNLSDLLAREGASLADVVKTTIFLVDMDDYAEMNEVWVGVLDAEAGGHRPTRSAVAVAALPIGARVEVEAWARVPG